MSKQQLKDKDQMTKRNIHDVQQEYKINLEKPFKVSSPGDFSRRILQASDVALVGGPFHYSIRSGTYGDPVDEIPWKVRMGMADTKERTGYKENPLACNYGSSVLIENWVEERRDRNYIKYFGKRSSQYSHYFISEAMRAYTKPLCNKQRDVLLNISTFPITSYPGHQPEINVDTLRLSAPKPDSCVVDEEIAKCAKEMERQKRYYKASLEI